MQHQPNRHLAMAVLAAATLGIHNLAAAQAVDVHTFSPTSTIGAGESASVTASLLKNSYSDNPTLGYSGWPHTTGGFFYAFEVTTTTDVTIDLLSTDSTVSFNPALTVWATGSSIFNGGSDDGAEESYIGWNSPHALNVTGQVGDFGTAWATGSYGNILETLAYAVTGPSHTAAETAWGQVINTGVNDISLTNTFEQGVTGTATGNSIHLTFNDLAVGWYVTYIGGSNNAATLRTTDYTLTVSAANVTPAVPEPSTLALLAAGLGLIGLHRARQKA